MILIFILTQISQIISFYTGEIVLFWVYLFIGQDVDGWIWKSSICRWVNVKEFYMSMGEYERVLSVDGWIWKSSICWCVNMKEFYLSMGEYERVLCRWVNMKEFYMSMGEYERVLYVDGWIWKSSICRRVNMKEFYLSMGEYERVLSVDGWIWKSSICRWVNMKEFYMSMGEHERVISALSVKSTKNTFNPGTYLMVFDFITLVCRYPLRLPTVSEVRRPFCSCVHSSVTCFTVTTNFWKQSPYLKV